MKKKQPQVGRGVLVALIVAVIALAGIDRVVASDQQPTYDIHMIVAHDPAPPYYMQAMKQFADTVESESNGHIRVQVLTSSQWGNIDMRTITDAVSDGKIEMSASTVSSLGRLDKDFWALEMPYLFDSYETAGRVIDGPIGKRLMDNLPAHNLRGLAYTYSGGFKVVSSNVKPLRTPADFKGITVLANDPVNMASFRALGAKVIEGGYRQSKELMASNTVQASDMTYTRYYEYQASSKYVNEIDHSFFLTTLLINEAFYQKLPPEYREIVARAAQKVAIQERARTVQENARIRDLLASQGITIITATPAEKAQLKAATAPMYKQFAGYFSPGLLDQLVAAVHGQVAYQP